MASRKRRSRRPAASQQPGSGPRRLGGQPVPASRSASAERRYQRTHRQGSSRVSWVVVGVVVAIVAVLVIVKVTSSNGSAGVTSGDNPAAVPAAVETALAGVPVSVYNSAGTGAHTDPFTELKSQPDLTEHGLPRIVYIGAEYCPYCAIMRWSLVAALLRFGTFTGLKETTSSTDLAPVPTFSFLGASYTSKYVAFTSYETEDRLGKTLQAMPTNVDELVTTYDTTAAIPFLDIANQDVTTGAPPFLVPSLDSPPISAIAGAGTGDMQKIAQAIADPASPYGGSINAVAFDVETNFMTAAICRSDGGRPSAVCDSPGVRAAEKAIAVAKKVS
ncbi:MAG: DUF929 family protein [Acidimicrobiales bacterium]|jgi:hypothetical protein